MGNFTERQKLILALVIRDYIDEAKPVGSIRLVKHYGLDVSSATVRNEMMALTEEGFLRQPHTSAGRVPTEEGYRYFVRQLMGHTDLSPMTKRTIAHQFHQTGQDVDHWMRLAASVLAHHSQAASLVTAPHSELARFKHIELIGARGRQVLMVLVLAASAVQAVVVEYSAGDGASEAFVTVDFGYDIYNFSYKWDGSATVSGWDMLDSIDQADAAQSGTLPAGMKTFEFKPFSGTGANKEAATLELMRDVQLDNSVALISRISLI